MTSTLMLSSTMTVLNISICHTHTDKLDGNRVVHVSAQLLLVELFQIY